MDVTAMAAKLCDSDPAVRAAAAEELAHLAEGAQRAAVGLVQAMGDRDESVRNWAYAALEELGPPHADDATALAKLAADPRLDVAYWAVTLMGRLGGEGIAEAGSTVVIGALIAALESHAEIAVRQRAAWALGEFAPLAAPARGALTTASTSSDPRLARLSYQALAKLT